MALAVAVAMKLEIPGTVSEIMVRDVVSVDESDSLNDLLTSLHAMRFRHLPVTDGDRLIGLLTERDLLGIATSSLWPHHGEQDRALQTRFRVRDIMVKDVTTVSPDTSVREAGKLLLQQRFGCLPVVDANNVLLGILTSSDFVRLVAHAQGGGGTPLRSRAAETQ